MATAASCEIATQLFGVLEAYVVELKNEVARKQEFLRGQQDEAMLNSEEQEEDMSNDQDENEDIPTTNTLTHQAMDKEAEGNLTEAATLYLAGAQPSLEALRINSQPAIMDVVALAAFVRFYVRNCLEMLQNNEDMANSVYEAFNCLRVVDPQTYDGLRCEFAIFLEKVDEDDEAAAREFETALNLRRDDDDGDVGLAYNAANFFSNRDGASPADLNRAETLYRAVLQLEPDHVLTLNNLGAFLVEKYRNSSSDLSKANKDAILTEAAGLLRHAEDLAPGAPAYNLACIYAILGDYESCKTFLLQAIPNLELNRRDVESDPDLATVRKQEWFRTLLKQLKA